MLRGVPTLFLGYTYNRYHINAHARNSIIDGDAQSLVNLLAKGSVSVWGLFIPPPDHLALKPVKRVLRA